MVNREFVESLYDILNTFHEVVLEMQNAYAKENYDLYYRLSEDLIENVTEVRGYAKTNLPQDDKSRMADVCTCIIESAKNIERLAENGSKEVAWKLEYELENIVESGIFQLEYYYWVEVGLESKEQFKDNFSQSHIMKNRCKVGLEEYSCDLSILIIGYNKLAYTKECVEHVLLNMPEDIRTELVLVNHGSSDGTQEFFESIENAHVLNYAVNGAVKIRVFGSYCGKYALSISNDVIVGKNSIKNIYRAVSENPEYGYVVPSTSNVSNLQFIETEYDNVEEFERFTDINNVYDVRRHEQRVRLCDPLSAFSLDIMYDLFLDMFIDLYFEGSSFSFPDDKMCLWMRRNGYKNILLKDAYCHHYGSVTLKNDKESDNNSQDFFNLGRKKFYEKYGVNPWGTGCCYSKSLFKTFSPDAEDDAIVLGINCGLGSNSLKIREIMKEKGADNVKLINVTQSEAYLEDLKGISDEAFLIKDLEDIITKIGNKAFKYIVVDDAVEGIDEITELVSTLEKLGIEYDSIMINRVDDNWLILKKKSKEA